MRMLFLPLLLLFLFSPKPSLARQSDKEIYPSIYEEVSDDYYIYKDGSSRNRHKVRWRIQNDAGRQHGSYHEEYNGATTKVKVLNAHVTNEKTVSVDDKYIEDRLLPTDMTSIDYKKQLTIAFQDVRVGSVLEAEVEFHEFAPQIKNLFREVYVLDHLGYIEKLHTQIESEIPLYFEINDPKKLLHVESSQKDGHYFYTISNTQTINLGVSEEIGNFYTPEDSTWVAMSSSTDYLEIAKKISPEIEKKYIETTPKELLEIIHSAGSVTDPTEQVRLVSRWVINNFRYLGDWRRETSGDIPRDLQEIIDTHFGDCKDFSLLTSYILRKIGFVANTAWIFRGEHRWILPTKVAVDNFNHAIVRAEKNGKKFWVDTTNVSTYANGIFPDISGRPALVLDPVHPSLVETDAIPPENLRMERTITRDLSGKESSSQFLWKYLGAAASYITGIGNYTTPADIKYRWLSREALQKNISSSEMHSSDLNDKDVSDAFIKIDAKEKIEEIKSSAGKGVEIPSEETIGHILQVYAKERVSALNLLRLEKLVLTSVFQNLRIIGKVPKDCDVKSPWLEAERKTHVQGKNVVVVDTITTYREYIRPGEFHTSEFAEFQKKLNQCFNQVFLIYQVVKK